MKFQNRDAVKYYHYTSDGNLIIDAGDVQFVITCGI